MPNINCLENIKCPQCGNEDRFIISACVNAEVTDDGADIASTLYGTGFEWDDDSVTRCPECDKEGTLKDFYINNAESHPDSLSSEMLAALEALASTARTFRDALKDDQQWTSLDDDALNQAFAVIAKAKGNAA